MKERSSIPQMSPTIGTQEDMDSILLLEWLNEKLCKVGGYVGNMHKDFRDGRNLILLLELLSGVQIHGQRGRLRVHMLKNVRTVLTFLESYDMEEPPTIRAEDIVDGHATATLGLLRMMKQQFPDAQPQLENKSDKSGQIVLTHSFWQKRMKSLIPLKLPYENIDDDADSKWEISAWWEPLLDPRVGNAERVLLDAFVIYLARISGDTELHIGWAIQRTKIQQDVRGPKDLVVPMIVTVSLDYSWGSVSEAIDSELVNLALNISNSFVAPLRDATYQTVSVVTTSWRIVVTTTSRDTTDLKELMVQDRALILQIDENGGFRWIYDAAILSADVIERMSGHLKELVTNYLTSTCQKTPIFMLNILPDEEKNFLLRECNASDLVPANPYCIHQLFEQQVSIDPIATALIFKNESVSYGELNARANRLARELIKLGVVSEMVVAICVPRSPALVVAVLAVLKAGGACLPLNTAYSSLHLIDLIDDAAADILIADDVGRSALIECDFSQVTVIDPNELYANYETNPEVPNLTSHNLAYVLYTSGTTGRSKGVMVEHRNVVEIFEANEALYEFNSKDVWFHIHSVAFAFALLEFWGPLRCGAKLVLLPSESDASLDTKQNLIIKHRVTVLTQTPTAFKALISQCGTLALHEHLRYVAFAGEPLNPTDLGPLFDMHDKTVPKFVNMFGASETMFPLGKVILQQDTKKNQNLVGFRLKNVRIFLLDPYRQPVPYGAVGELCVQSNLVTRGYLNRPELTKERFIVDCFRNSNGPVYRTGDLAKYLPNGSVVIIGRNDRQIKIRGYRIEAVEVEGHLKDHYAVRDALVVTSGEDLEKRLVAYVVAEAIDDLPQRLYVHLSFRLPAFMVPIAFVAVDKFPRTPNGKLNIRSLPPVDETSLVRGSYEPPRGDIEVCLARVWEKVFDLEQVGRHDSFFALGGHSLLAMRVIEDMRMSGLSFDISNLFKFPVLSDLARTVERNELSTVPINLITSESTKITPAMLPLIDITQSDIDKLLASVPDGLPNVQDIYALSPSQDGILFHHMYVKDGDPYLVTKMSTFPNYDQLSRYLTALQEVIDRHDILRTCFIWEGLSVPVQIVCRRAIMSVIEHTFEPDGVPLEDKLSNCYGAERYRIDLGVPPLIHAVIVRQDDGHWILLNLIHHIIYDERTSSAIDSEISELLKGHAAGLRESIPYRNHIARIRQGIDDEDGVRLFTEMLSDIDEPTLPFGLVPHHNMCEKIVKHRTELDPKLGNQLRVYARSLAVSLATLFHIAWAVVVSRSSGNERIVFGTVLSGRMRTREGSNIGMGLFINTLPIRFNIDDTTIRTCIRQAQAQLARLLEHEYVSLASAQRYSCVESGTALFSSLLNYRHLDSLIKRSDAAPFRVLREESQTHYPLVLSINDNDVKLSLELDVSKQIDPCRVCNYVHEALGNLIVALDRPTELKICSIEILPETERNLLLEAWNQPVNFECDPICVHQYFERQVSCNPSSLAIIFGDSAMTYLELNKRANQLAHHLIEIGVRPETCVGICVSVSPAMMIGLLAVLKAGGAYVPLDPLYPKQRLVDIINDASLEIIIADECGKLKLDVTSKTNTVVVDANESFFQSHKNPVVEELSSKTLAYVIFTSGSSGRPKGVMVEHRNIVSLFEATASLFKFTISDVWCLYHSIAFDFSVWEMWGALLYSGQLVLMSRDEARSLEATYNLICQHGVTVLNQTPSAFKARIDVFIEKGCPNHLRYIIFGGESLDPSILQPLYAKYGDSLPQFVNMFGTTETTVHSCHIALETQDTLQSTSLIGKRLLHTSIYVLDRIGNPVPVGAVGELCIGGAGVARGYLNRSNLTNERFLADTMNVHANGRLYKTGDLARFLPNGNLVFLGRSDQQVKIRGYRIETGEIEACLRKHPAVRDAVVSAMGENTYERLVAYVVADAIENLPRILEAHVSSQLPEFMVPAAIIPVDIIPKSQNGKVDLRALPTPSDTALARRAHEAPQGNVEITLARIWRDLLDIERISRSDSFFALGGNSLHAMRMVERMRSYGHRLTIHDVYLHRTLFAIGRTVQHDYLVTVPSNVITPGITKLTPEMLPLIDLFQADIDEIISHVPDGIKNIQDIYALSPLQDGILLHHILATGGDPYLIAFQFAVEDHAILDRYMAAVQKIIDRHDILRTLFLWEGLSVPAQVVLRETKLSITELSLTPDTVAASEQIFQKYDSRSFPIDLRQAPLMKLVITRESNGSWVLLQLLHHIIGDQTLLRGIHDEAQAFMNLQETTLNSPAPYRNHIANFRLYVNPEAHADFFSQMLSDIHDPTLAFDLIDVYHDGSCIVESIRNVNSDLIEQLRSRVKELDLSLASVCHLAWAVVLSRVVGRNEVVFGTVLVGRMDFIKNSESALGLFVNTLPIKVITGNVHVIDCACEVQNTLARLLDHQYASLALIQRCSSVRNRTLLFNTLLNYRHNPDSVKFDVIADGMTLIGAYGRTNYPVTLSIDDDDNNLVLNSQTAASIDSDRVCGYMQRALESLAFGLDSAKTVPVRSLEVIPETESLQLLGMSKSTKSSHPDMICIHQQFEKQVIQSPTAVALVHEGEVMTYDELNTRANRLAHRLINLGVVPERFVGICMSVSPAMLVGLLAIFKAGCAYVFLNPAHPKQRLIDHINDASVSIVFADAIGRDKLIPTAVILIDPNEPLQEYETNPVVPELRSDNLAYVIYTSGSTGRPKGVMGEHRHIVRLFDTSELWFHFSRSEVWCLFHSIGFDVSIWEIWGALRYGGQLVLMSRDQVRSPEATYQLIREHRVTVLHQTPAAFKNIIDRLTVLPIRDHLRYIMLFGESLDANLLHPLYITRGDAVPRIFNLYGTTETVVWASYHELDETYSSKSQTYIRNQFSDLKMYVLDTEGLLSPFGVVGELYIGGAGVTRGYMNLSESTSNRFIPDKFNDAIGSRMFRTGDLVRYTTDGGLVYLGRNDQQVKVKGFRIEIGEIEHQLRCHPVVRDAAVVAFGDDPNKRLIAYVVCQAIDNFAQTMHQHLTVRLPEYMIPSAFLKLEKLPLTANGKLDKEALPSVDETSFVRGYYEAPQHDTEVCLADIWMQLLDVDKVSRHDSFFVLGGHSLLAMKVIEVMRSRRLTVTIRDIFQYPVLSDLAKTVRSYEPLVVPTNLFKPDSDQLRPEMFPLIDLTQSDIDHIVSQVPGGISNIQDIYDLSPIQHGILFHHLLSTNSDPYLTTRLLSFENYDQLDRYIKAFQSVIDEHDILRTAVFWKGTSVATQVVWRRVLLPIIELTLDMTDESVVEQLRSRYGPRRSRINLEEAPLIRCVIARDDGRWLLLSMVHHIIFDDITGAAIDSEIGKHLDGHTTCSKSLTPFRNYIAQVRQDFRKEAATRFFTEMLDDIEEPTIPFGLTEIHDTISHLSDSDVTLDSGTISRLRRQAKSCGVSLATLCHVAWALIVSRISGQTKPVFGTVLFGRMSSGMGSNFGVGVYVNTLPFRVDINDSPVCAAVRRTHEQLAQLLEYEHASLALAQRCSRVARGTSLFSSLLNYRHKIPAKKPETNPSSFHLLGVEGQTNYPLVLKFDDNDHKLELSVQVAEPIVPFQMCQYTQETLLHIVNALEYSPTRRTCSVEILPENERMMLLQTWNRTVESKPDAACLHQIFEAHVLRRPCSTAVSYNNESVTYAELNLRANRLAHKLMEIGVVPDGLVGICTSVSIGMLVGVLAVLKAGGAYVSLDPLHPEQRLKGIIDDASLDILIADQFGIDRLGLTELEIVIVDPNTELLQLETNPVVVNLTSHNLAYVIYTSGTTGCPKGVTIEHRSVVRLFEGTETLFHFDEYDVWCLFHSIAFDVSVWEMWGALLHGGQLVLMSPETVRSPEAMYDLIREYRVTVLNQTPSAFKTSMDEFLKKPINYHHLRYVVFAGEKLDPRILHSSMNEQTGTSPEFVNMYGITETTVHVTHKKLGKLDTAQPLSLIGKSLAHTKLYLLNAHGLPVPLGAVGEIYVGGSSVARGYLNKPDLTSERFLPDPFSESMSGRMYKTGDMARCLPNGDIVFIGRNDQQVKVRGYRIETGDVEACLRSHPTVRDALVIAIGDHEDKYLVAYVVADIQDNLAAILRSFAEKRLPAFMLPSAVVRLDAIPLTRNGKADLRALPRPDDTALAQQTYEAPQGEVESALAEVWEKVLNIGRVSRRDSFFALGGHSLNAMRMIERMRRYGYKISIRDLFLHPTISALALTVESDCLLSVPENVIVRGTTMITPDMLPLIDLTQQDIDRLLSEIPGGIDNVQDIYALSPLQDGILFHHLLANERDPYLLITHLTFSDRIILDRYISAFQKVIDRHDILRTAFFWEELSAPAQVVFRNGSPSVVELSIPSGQGSLFERILEHSDQSLHRMDLRHPPLWRFLIARETDGSWVMIQLLHHIIISHTLLELINLEILAYLSGREDTLDTPAPFRNFIVNTRSAIDQNVHSEFFSRMLSDVDEPTLAFGLTEVHLNGLEIRESQYLLPDTLSDHLRREAKKLHVSPAAFFHLAWALILSRTSGQQKVVFGTVLFGQVRSDEGAHNDMGLFNNTLPVKVTIDETPVRECLHQTHNILADLLEHAHASLALAQRSSSVTIGSPLFNALLNYRHNLKLFEVREIAEGITFHDASERTNYPLVSFVDDNGSSLSVTCQSAKPIDPVRICTYMHQTSEFLLVALDSPRPVTVCSIDVVSKIEHESLADNEICGKYMHRDQLCVHQLFENQVARSGTASAILHEKEVLTYCELNARANYLAQRLIALGVIPDTLIGICVCVSSAMVIGILAILKAGGAYVPLDPEYPGRRLRDVIRDASLKIVITDAMGSQKFETETLELIVIDLHTQLPSLETNPVVSDLWSTNLAYVIYTSGSTGRPKGVMVEHRNVVGLLDATESLFKFNENDIWCLFHSIAFDVSVWEMWSALLHGGKLLLMSPETVRSPEAMYDLIREHRVTVLNQTPSAFKTSMDEFFRKPINYHHLRYVVFAGEKLDPRILHSSMNEQTGTSPEFVNMYGITETTVYLTYKELTNLDTVQSLSLIGSPLAGSKIYLLDAHGLPVPFGAIGEIYIGGSLVTRGYLNRPDQTSERFLPDPYTDSIGTRMYKTGDMARYSPNGDIVFIGRNDQQVKVRGYRIETGDVEACLRSHPTVRDALVIAIGDHEDKYLVAYVVADIQDNLAAILRSFAEKRLPEFMLPSAVVRLDAIPLTRNGKADLRALPRPDDTALAQQTYEAPQGEVESALAEVWREVLNIGRVSRRDSFFALGGHSLNAVRMIERMRRHGYKVSIRDLFLHSTLSELALTVKNDCALAVPENIIARGTTMITPEMLPLIDLTQQDIDRLLSEIPGGIDNVQDIYALSPLQDGILFHHLLAHERDPYLLIAHLTFSDRIILDRYISAFQKVIDRHDILRTAFFWEGLSAPAQVVFRNGSPSVIELSIPSGRGSLFERILEHSDQSLHRMDLRHPPLWRFLIARETDGSWVMIQLLHHIIISHTLLDLINSEILAYLSGREYTSDTPAPFRNFIAGTRFAIDQNVHSEFFSRMLSDVDEPTLAFGLAEVHLNDSEITESPYLLPDTLSDQLRQEAKKLHISPASFFHLAWALILSRSSGQQKVVFGTVLFGQVRTDEAVHNDMGLFINTLPVRVTVDETPVPECLYRTHKTLAELLEHEHASLALAQRSSCVSSGSPLFNALMNYRHNSTVSRTRGIAEGVTFYGTSGATNYPLVSSVNDDGSSLVLICQSAQPIDPECICTYTHRSLESLVVNLNSPNPVSVRAIDFVPEIEYKSFSDTGKCGVDMHRDQLCVHQLFEKQAARSGTASAILHEGEVLTYSQLNGQVNHLAQRLIALGVMPESLIGICMPVSLAMVIGILAILKAGGAYVPLDPEYPKRRLQDVIRDATLKIVITDAMGSQELETETLELIVIDLNTPLPALEKNPIVFDLRSTNLAYVIYTSGSTGRPKGVMVEHRNVVNLFDATESLFKFDGNDIWCLFHSIAFDASVWEMWGALLHGGQLVLMSPERVRSPEAMYDLIREHRVTVLNQTPSAFSVSVDEFLKNSVDHHLRYVVFFGEKLDPRILHSSMNQQSGTSPKFVNMYGITETTVHVTHKELVKLDTVQQLSLIGRPLAHTRLYLLDAHGLPVPFGAVGEIYVGGSSVARGYLNKPDLTSERFLPDPFSESMSGRMYKTGDMARCLPNGDIVFIGRNDQQVKVRGYRIETGDVEACLRSHPIVRDALVIAIGDHEDKYLVAYVVADIQDNLAAILRSFAEKRLPEFMLPSAVVRLDAIPLTRNGKADLRALPRPDDTALAQQTYEAPQGEVESALADVWREVLNIGRVSRRDSFFALGGHSLNAVRMIERMRRHGYKVSIRDLFLHSTLSELALTVKNDCALAVPENIIARGTTMITPEMLPLIDLTQQDIDRLLSEIPGGIDNVQDIYALSPLQDGILFHHLLAHERDPYLLIAHLTFSDRIILDRYISAFQKVIDRHDILRTAFFWEGLSAPAQVVFRNGSPSVIELSVPSGRGSLFERILEHSDQSLHRIDLRHPPLWRFLIARETDGSWVMIQLLHHIIISHTLRDLVDLEVLAHFSGREDTLDTPAPFRNFIANARSAVGQKVHSEFFSRMLSDVDEPTLAFGLTEVHLNGSEIRESQYLLPDTLSDHLRREAKKLCISPASFSHLAWALISFRSSGQQKVVFGTVLVGQVQSYEGVHNDMGLFINTLPVRVTVDETPVPECLHRTHKTLAELLEHEHALLAVAQRSSRVSMGTPLFNALLNYRHHFKLSQSQEIAEGVTFHGATGATNYPLVLSVDDDGSRLAFICQSAQPINSERICTYMHQALESLVVALNSPNRVPVHHVDIIPTTEYESLTGTEKCGVDMYRDQLCVHQFFEKQVARSGTASAILHEKEVLTYRDLNVRANHLAQRLIALGLMPDTLIGICARVSSAMVIAIFAILKAGCAYVPLDPEYPRRRLRDVIQDASLRIVITDAMGSDKLETETLELIVIDLKTPLPAFEKNPVVSDLRSTNLAYVIYTSGSTGRPKGVMVEHRHVVSLFDATESLFKFDGNDVWCLFHSIAFDVSVYEIWGPLLYGGRLVLMSRETVRSPKAMYDLIREHRVTVLNQTPSAFRTCIDEFLKNPINHHLRYVVFAGEKLDPRILYSSMNERSGTSPKFVNMYGITETTVYLTHQELKKLHTVQSLSLIGSPLAGSKIYLLDAHGLPVPFGAVGEIYVGGSLVTRGYLNRPDLTSQRFLPDPFADSMDARMYKTGDLGSYTSDGNLVFLERIDHQVQIRGFRVELGEIEACLVSHPNICEAAVLCFGDTPDSYLVAYVVADVREDIAHRLREHLISMLPDYMIPSRFVHLESLPLTSNFKLDRKALPAPEEGAVVRRVYESPISNAEWMLANIWCQLLGIDRVGRNDNFFALGGHSLIATRMINLAADRGIILTLNDVFQYPVLGDLASRNVANTTIQRGHVAIAIRSSGTESPLFFVPTGQGDLSHVYALSVYIRKSVPIYALPWPIFKVDQISSMKNLASKMIRLIKAVQEHGPYRLCGYSSGGILAHAIANALEKVAESVTFVGLIDTMIPESAVKRITPKRRLLSAVLDTPASVERQNDIALLSEKIDEMSTINFVEAAKKLQLYPSNLNSQLYAQQLEECINYYELASTYQPQDLRVPVHQFNAIDNHTSIDPAVSDLSANYSSDWAARLPKTSFRITRIPGGHLSMFENPENRIILGQAINDAIPQ